MRLLSPPVDECTGFCLDSWLRLVLAGAPVLAAVLGWWFVRPPLRVSAIVVLVVAVAAAAVVISD